MQTRVLRRRKIPATMIGMERWTYDDGGRAAAGFKGEADDCVVRALAIATGTPYREVYDELWERIRTSRNYQSAKAHGTRTRISPRNGVPRSIYEPWLTERGWEWCPTMAIGSGTTVHLRADELPSGRILAKVSKHFVAVIDGIAHDTHDPTREGTRAVYGYFSKYD